MSAPVRLQLPTVHCGTCRGEVTAALEAVPGVVAVRVDLHDRSAEVHRDDRRPSRAVLVAALVAAGHPPATSSATQSRRKPAPTARVHGAGARPTAPGPLPTGDVTGTPRSDEDELR